jgi:hypothetical protein
MEWKLLFTVFASVFVAEMADKTQLVTLLFAADRDVSKWTVFFGSASALVLTSADVGDRRRRVPGDRRLDPVARPFRDSLNVAPR